MFEQWHPGSRITMSDRARIDQAITVLGAQRKLIGDAVADTTIVALQEKLASLQKGEPTVARRGKGQGPQITTLYARVTGRPITPDSDVDADLKDTPKRLWRRLDDAITEHGGLINRQFGDGVMGLFGAHMVRENEAEHAIRAALAMRAVLSDFVNELTSSRSAGIVGRHQRTPGRARPLGGLQLRIGVNTGSVMLGKGESGDEVTVTSAAANVASRLGLASPSGGILISHQTYLQVRGIFTVEPLGPVAITGKSEPVQSYLVLGVNPRVYDPSLKGMGKLVGRVGEINELQDILHRVEEKREVQVVTIRGEAGVGKTRLVQEFTNWAVSRRDKIARFRGRADQQMSRQPYSVIRDLLATYFGIQDSDQPIKVAEKVANKLDAFWRQEDTDEHATVQIIGGLFGLGDSRPIQTMPAGTKALRTHDGLLKCIAEIFKAVASKGSVMLMILEDMQWADEQSVELVNQLAFEIGQSPLMMILLTRARSSGRQLRQGMALTEQGMVLTEQGMVLTEQEAALTEQGMALTEQEAALTEQEAALTEQGMALTEQEAALTEDENVTSEIVRQTIELEPLSQGEGRQLVAEILGELTELPVELSDLIVERAEGNPLHTEELVRVLIEDGVIIAGPQDWSVQQGRYRNIRMPTALTGVLHARLNRLSYGERATLQRAAVMGQVFWDGALVQIGEMDEKPLPMSETMAAIEALERRELIFHQDTSSYADTQEYIFKSAVLRDVVYESVLLRRRPSYHRLAGNWLAEHSRKPIAEYAGLIAEHYEKAGSQIFAAELYEVAASRAQGMNHPDVAIDYYCRSLSMLVEEQQHAAWQLRLQEELGRLLRMQARLVDATQTYLTMVYVAQMDGDLIGQARAWNGLAWIHREQASYESMLQDATQAEQVAWLIGANDEFAAALLHKSEAYFQLGDSEMAVEECERAIKRSRSVDNYSLTTQGLSLLCLIHIDFGNRDEAGRLLGVLKEEAKHLEADNENREQQALLQITLGKLYNCLGELEEAGAFSTGALELYRLLDSQAAVASTLNVLGDSARIGGDPAAALSFYREATDVASAIGDELSALDYRVNLGGTLVSLGQYETAIRELHHVTRLGTDFSRAVNWARLPKAFGLLAGAYLGQEDLREALEIALKAHLMAKETREPLSVGTTWRVLGSVAAELPAEELPIIIDDDAYNARGCFAESMRILRQFGGGSASAHWEQSEALLAWSAHELSQGNWKAANQMRAEAEALLARFEGAQGDTGG
jgi:predicted ATPase/class 3 adenylate cyclase